MGKNIATTYPASTLDYFPTFMDIIGLIHPHPQWPIDGRSLLPLIHGKERVRSTPIGHIFTQDGEWGKGASSPWDAWSHASVGGQKVRPVSAPKGHSEPPADVTAQARQVSRRVDNLKLYGWRAKVGDTW